MSPARRSRRKRDWPRGLYEPRAGYYVWRSPAGETMALGRVPLAEALTQAIAANLHVMGARPTLVQRLSGEVHTVADLLEKMPEAKTINTAKAERSQDKAIIAALGEMACGKLTVADCASLVESYADAGKRRMAQAIRARLISVCRRGMQLGWMSANPAEVTGKPSFEVQRGRLTLGAFQAIYDMAPRVAEWLQRAMQLALVTGADRSTIAGMTRAMVGDGLLTFRRGKTGAWIAVPLDLTMDCMGWRLGDIVAERTGVLSPLLVHHVNPYGNAPAGSKVHPDTISHSFRSARRLAGIPDEGAPTFHEIRSLCKRLYDEQGNVDTKALLGHATERMADLYANPRGLEPVRIKISK